MFFLSLIIKTIALYHVKQKGNEEFRQKENKQI